MEHEQIEGAIERLKKITYRATRYNALEVIEAVIPDGSWVDCLIDLLKQADPATHMELPVGADGVPIRIGDEVCGYDHPNGGVYCHAIVNPCVIAVGDMRDYSNNKGWALWHALGVTHYHKPTVEDVLQEMLTKHLNYFPAECVDGLIADYAAKLREVMADDDAR